MTSSSSPHPDAASLLALLDRFAAIGATPAGGVTRLCGSAEDGQARALFRGIAQAAGARVTIDEVGNQFALFRLAQGVAPAVMMGSHLDSQIRAGRFDGTLGVATALCVGEALLRARRQGAAFNADFIAVNWTNEEGARFRPSLLGSGTYAGSFTPDYALSRCDDQGMSLRAALGAIGSLGTDLPPPAPACYLELHIEQGSVLEEAKARIGIVTGNWSALKLEALFLGEQAHTGPTPMARRRDALLGAAYAIAGIRAVAERWPGEVHTAVARVLVEPNSANVVPARVSLAVEVRARSNEILEQAVAAAEAALRAAATQAGVGYEVAARAQRPVQRLPEGPAALVRACAQAARLEWLEMSTVAGHDALSLLSICPVGLIFVPSIGGITHNEAENTAAPDIAAGFEVALRAATGLCQAKAVPEAALALHA